MALHGFGAVWRPFDWEVNPGGVLGGPSLSMGAAQADDAGGGDRARKLFNFNQISVAQLEQ